MMTEGCYIVDGEIKNLLEENWDFLIILDACRYDYFKETYGNYLDGDVKKAVSPAIHTMDWLDKVFPDFYEDIVYVSANPYINSKIEVTDSSGNKFDAKKHFFKIIDVWKGGWNNQLGSVLPSEINEATLKAKVDYKNKRFILHYIQPHAPYISENYAPYIPAMKSIEETWAMERIHSRKTKNTNVNIRTLCREVIQKSFGLEVAWMIGRLLKLPIDSQVGAIGYKEGIEGLRNAYRENLEFVLEVVSEVVKNVSGTILITADHGEYLGENGRYGHGSWPRRPPNTEVPWLIVEKNNPIYTINREKSEKMLIIKQINNLKLKYKI